MSVWDSNRQNTTDCLLTPIPRPGQTLITLDGYFEPVAQALINSSSPHLNIWGGGLDRPEFLDADYEFGIQSDLVIGRNVMFSGIVDDGLTVVSRPAYLVTVEVESLRPGAAPQRIMVTFTVSARRRHAVAQRRLRVSGRRRVLRRRRIANPFEQTLPRLG